MRSTNDGVAPSPFTDRSHASVSKHSNQGTHREAQPNDIKPPKSNDIKPSSEISPIEIPKVGTPEVIVLPVLDTPIVSTPVPDQASESRVARNLPIDPVEQAKGELQPQEESTTGLWVSIGLLAATGAGLVAGTYYSTRKKEKFTKVETTEMNIEQSISEGLLEFENPDVRNQKGYKETSNQWE